MFSKFINKGYEAQSCQICHTNFNLLKLERIHKCKRCSKYICFKCGNHKQKVIGEDDKWSQQPHRVCTQCWTELNSIHDMIMHNGMEWNRQSKFAKQWIHAMNNGVNKDYEYEHFLKLFYSNIQNFEEQNQIIEKDVIKGRTDYTVFNYSLKQFFYIVQQKQQVVFTRKNTANVLYAIAARYDQIGYVQGMSNIAAYLLCFSDQKGAFAIFCDIIQKIYPPKFFVKGNYGVNLLGLMAQIHFLKAYFIYWVKDVKTPLIIHQRNPYQQDQLDQIVMIVQLSAAKALLSLFTSLLAYSHIDFIWKQLKKQRSFQVVERAFLAAMYLKRDSFLQKKSFKDLQKLFEMIHIDEFIEAYYDMQIDKTMRAQIMEQYYDSLSKKWSSNLDYNIRNLYKFTNFTQQQMKLIQNYFLGKQKGAVQNFYYKKEKFIELVKCFYQILKKESTEEEPIIQITPYFVSKVYDTYNQNKKQGLDFRQFICCLSACTKSKLKQRLCAIINTYEDKNHHISHSSFDKLIKSLCQLSPETINEHKQAFLLRMDKYFKNQQKISISQLHVLLNDGFINQLAVYIKSETPDIIQETIKLYSQQSQQNFQVL